MIGAIIGDIVGSAYEKKLDIPRDFELFTRESMFTDDTVLTIAVMQHLLTNVNPVILFKGYYSVYPDRCYGYLFHKWAESFGEITPYGSWGNGGAMRISPVSYLPYKWEQIADKVRYITNVTHNTEEAITGALAISECIYRSKETESKEIVKFYASKYYPELKGIVNNFDSIKLDFDCSTKGTVPYAIAAFLKSDDFESCLRNAVLLGGDTDTISAMACSIAESFYKEIPVKIVSQALCYLPDEFLRLLNYFYSQYYNKNYLYIEDLKSFAYSAAKRNKL